MCNVFFSKPYLGGVDCNIAITRDNGESWLNVSLRDLLPGVSQNDPIYGLEYHNGRIYAAVLPFGVAYSDDDGNNWALSDLESLLDDDDPEIGGHRC